MKSKILKKSLFTLAALTILVVGTSCVPLAIGAAGGYVASEEGYRVQSPVTKD